MQLYNQKQPGNEHFKVGHIMFLDDNNYGWRVIHNINNDYALFCMDK